MSVTGARIGQGRDRRTGPSDRRTMRRRSSSEPRRTRRARLASSVRARSQNLQRERLEIVLRERVVVVAVEDERESRPPRLAQRREMRVTVSCRRAPPRPAGTRRPRRSARARRSAARHRGTRRGSWRRRRDRGRRRRPTRRASRRPRAGDARGASSCVIGSSIPRRTSFRRFSRTLRSDGGISFDRVVDHARRAVAAVHARTRGERRDGERTSARTNRAGERIGLAIVQGLLVSGAASRASAALRLLHLEERQAERARLVVGRSGASTASRFSLLTTCGFLRGSARLGVEHQRAPVLFDRVVVVLLRVVDGAEVVVGERVGRIDVRSPS